MGDTPLTTAAVPEAPATTASAPPLNPIAYAGGLEGARRRRQAGRRPGRQGRARRRPGRRRRSASGRRRRAQGRGGRCRRRSDRLPPSTRAWPRRWRSRLQRRPRRRARRPSEADKTAAQSELTRAQAALVEARAREATKSPAAFAAVETWKRAVAASEAAGNLVDEADRRQRAGVGVHQQEGRPHLHPPGLEGSVGGACHLPRPRPSARHARLHGDRRGAGRLVDALDGDIDAARERSPAEATRSRRARTSRTSRPAPRRQRRKRPPARSTASSCPKARASASPSCCGPAAR